MRSTATELTRAGRRSGRVRAPGWPAGLRLSLVAVVVFALAAEAVGQLARLWLSPGPVSSGAARLLDPWNRWDADWYIAVARHGYVGTGSISGTTGLYQQAVAFPPGLPLAIRGVGAGLHLSPVVAATAIVMTSLLLAVLGLHRLASLDARGRAPLLTVVALLCFPTAFVLIAPYAEAPVLAAGVWAFVAARRRWWLVAGLLAAAAVLLKIYAVVLVAGLLVEVVQLEPRRRAVAAAAAVAGLPALALGWWMAWQASTFGDPLRFLHAERAWGRQLAAPLAYVGGTLADLPGSDPRDGLPALLDVLAPILLIALAVPAWRMRRSYAVVMVLSALAFGSTSIHDSVSRYAVGVFPLFLVAGRLLAGRPRLAVALATLSAVAGGFMAGLFTTGWFVG